jgi:SAM-dependent methyltransferase
MLPSVQSPTEAYNRDFADYYDRITRHKDYAAEIETLTGFIRNNTRAERPRILDVGCGTGIHAVLLTAQGYDVTAIDLSPDMIRVALSKETRAKFMCGDVGTLPEGGFQFAYSLFNVANCLGTLDALVAFLGKIHARLTKEGILLLECWNPIAVIAAPPEVVERTFESDGAKIVRTVTPMADFLRQRLDLEYQIDVYEGGAKRPTKRFTVMHNLTLFTPIEIEFCLGQAGFKNTRMYTALPEMAEAKANDRMLAFSCEK